MNKEYIQTLYNYNAWANTRILDAAARLSQEQLTSSGGASYDSIHAPLVHILGAQELWLARWNEVSPRTILDPKDFSTLGEIRSYWNEIEAHTRAFVEAIDEADLPRVIQYINLKGETWKYPLWQMMVHQVNHATQHRSEIAMILSQFGQSPGELDFLIYIDTTKPSRSAANSAARDT
jgi:uncharacterized damage-inducible protein DinB